MLIKPFFKSFIPQNSFGYRGSYFKLGGEGSPSRLVCVGVRVRRSKTGQSSHRVLLEASCSDVCRVQGFADLREGCHRGCHWRCHLMRVRVGIRSIFC